jgi:23S rRNA (adenine2503-C2)-methyltransferase
MTVGSSGPGDKPNLFGLDRGALAELLQRYDAPKFHAGQIYRWLYARRCFGPAGWTDLPRPLREKLSAETAVSPGRLAERTVADDGTIKYRTEFPDGDSVESVYMEQSGRVTLCVSSQVGCALNCDFCLTGKMGFVRHLEVGEILGQVALIQRDRALRDCPFNIVFMGMGEPLHNYDRLLGAIRILADGTGGGVSRRRITVSTAGLAPAIERLAGEPVRPRLAVSLNATTDAVRDRIMPINHRYPIARLLEACRRFSRTTGERFSFEYVLLAGINDTPEDVRRLATMVRRLPAKLNLIPFNSVTGWLRYRPPSRRRVIAVRDRLLEQGVPTSIRWSRGTAARAACGQLALLSAPLREAGGSEAEAGTGGAG